MPVIVYLAKNIVRDGKQVSVATFDRANAITVRDGAVYLTVDRSSFADIVAVFPVDAVVGAEVAPSGAA